MTFPLISLSCALFLARWRPPTAVVNRRVSRLAIVVRPRRTPRGLDSARLLPWSAAGAALMIGWALAGNRGFFVSLVASPVITTLVRRTVRGQVGRRRSSRDGLPLVLDLTAAALRAGAPVALAVRCGADSAPVMMRADLNRVAAMLVLGADAAEAWGPAQGNPALAPLAAVAIRSADSGIRLADGLDRRAVTLREEIRTSAIVRAQRVGVMALLPLGLCFLPAFVCLGVVPIITGVAGGMLVHRAP